MGMKPHPLFEAAWYIDVYSDVAEAGVNPLVHYLEIGGPEGRFPNPFFDGNWYQQQDEHLLQTRGNPLTHYVTVGAAQGRRPSPHFDPTSYPMQIPATTGLEMDQLSHFIVYGWGRNRRKALRSCGETAEEPTALDPLEVKTDASSDEFQDKSQEVSFTSSTALSSEPFTFETLGQHAWNQQGALSLTEALVSGAPIHFPKTDTPLLSIILVLFNKAHLTLLCLSSILRYCDVSYELVVVDNDSTDETSSLTALLRNIKLLRNEENLGFGLACMHGARVATGKYLCFLNNDALLRPDTVRAAVTFSDRNRVGAVGGKILFADGKLQEAGSILWSDGTTWGYGRGDDPGAATIQFPQSGRLLLGGISADS